MKSKKLFCGGCNPGTFDANKLVLIQTLLELKKPKKESSYLYKTMMHNLFLSKDIKVRGGTDQEILKLYGYLREAIGHLSGSQQNGGMGHPFDEKYDKECKQIIKRNLKKISESLLG